MIYLVNIATLLLAIIVALQIANERRKYLLAVAAIMLGLLAHVVEAFINLRTGACQAATDLNIPGLIDQCIDYEKGSMLLAQAMILAGFTVLIVGYLSARNQRNGRAGDDTPDGSS